METARMRRQAVGALEEPPANIEGWLRSDQLLKKFCTEVNIALTV